MADIDDINAAQSVKVIGSDLEGVETFPADVDARGRQKVVASFADSGQMDSFNRLRSSFPTTVFDSQFHFDKRSLIWDESVTGTATSVFDSNLHSIRFNLGTASGNQVVRQTFRRFKYDPGKSMLFIGTFSLGTPKTNTRKRVGYFDEANGLFFEVNGTTARVVIRSSTSGSVVDTAVDQASWNIDKLDGTGKSGHTVDFNNTQIFVLDFQWLGSGRIRFGFYFSGEIFYCHEITNINNGSGPYMQTANLPVRAEATNTGTTASDTVVLQTCQTVVKESLQEAEGVLRSVTSGIVSKTIGTTSEVPVLTIRLKASHAKAILDLMGVYLYITGNSDLLYRIRVGATLTGATFNSGSDFVEYDVAATALATPGTIVHNGYVRSSTSTPVFNSSTLLQYINLLIGADISNTPISITLTGQSLSGNSNVYGTMEFREVS